jgi:C4-type Zn-finger protein
MNPFIHRTSSYCPYCKKDSLALITTGPRDHITISKFVCKCCKHEFDINWTDRKNPRPIFTNINTHACLYKVQNYI